MSLKRVHTLYPYSVFRAQIVYKNIAPPDEKWAEGVLCRDSQGNFSIINSKAGGGYAMCPIYLDTLGLASGFRDGDEADIFEGDIISICRFSGDKAAPQAYFTEEGEPIEREVFADIPESCEKLSSFEGVVFMSGGVFFVQFFDDKTGNLNALPLYMFFGFDMLPADGAAVKVIGNMYDDEELFSKTLNLTELSQVYSK